MSSLHFKFVIMYELTLPDVWRCLLQKSKKQLESDIQVLFSMDNG